MVRDSRRQCYNTNKLCASTSQPESLKHVHLNEEAKCILSSFLKAMIVSQLCRAPGSLFQLSGAFSLKDDSVEARV